MRFRQLAPLLLISVLLPLINPTVAMAQNYDVVGTEATWRWVVRADYVNELEIDENGGGFSDKLNRDGFDDFGFVRIDGNLFNTNGQTAPIVDGSVTFTDADHPGDAVSYQFKDNWWQVTISLDVPGSIEWGNPGARGSLGSDSGTRWLVIDGKLFSYQNGSDYVYDDPIFYWPIPPASYTDTDDRAVVSASGSSFVVKLHAFAHQVDATINHTDYMLRLAQFASENVNRTDIFNYATWTPAPAPAPAPAETYVRKSTNLQFNEALHGSDKLSDPDGQLRKTVDSIDAKYGNLIK